MRYVRVAVLALVASLAAASLTPARADIGASVSVSFFYDNLAPHGEWISSAQFGYVWRPVHVYSGWRPYYDGQWVYTDYGWTFVSDDPWGWATYHYGRWYLDPYYGWLWVPGYEWAPAWVVFHQGAGYVGWAPLPPNVSLNLVVGGGYRVDPRTYCFVEERHFVDRRIRHRVVAPERNAYLVRSTANVTRFSRAGDRYLNRSLSTERIERAARQRIERRRVVDLSDRDRARVRVDRDEVAVFRPQVSRRATHPPRDVVRRDDERRGKIDRDRGSKREAPARIERRADERKSPPRVTTERRDQEKSRVDANRGPARGRTAVDTRRATTRERTAVENPRPTLRERPAIDTRRPTSRERSAVDTRRSTTRERAVTETRRPTTREQAAVDTRRSTTRERTAVANARPTPRERSAIETRRPISRERAVTDTRRPATRERAAADARRPTTRKTTAVDSRETSSRERAEASADDKQRSKGKKPASKRDAKRGQDEKKPPSRGSGHGA